MKQPNILLIVTDQQRRDTIGAYGSGISRTPSVDGLADEGMTFDFAFTPCGLCSPTRASLLTGVYPHTHGVLTNIHLHPVRTQLEPEADVLFKRLRETGYRLGYVGKWHANHYKEPPEFGVERYVSLGDYATYRESLGVPSPPEASNYLLPVSGVDPIGVEHSRPAFLADNTIRAMEEFSRDEESPFFIRLDFHGPHMPTVIPEPYASMYDPSSIPPYPNFDDALDGKPAVQSIKRKHWETEGMSWEDWQPLVARYYGEISLIDAQVGRVLEKLEELGEKDDTIVIYTTDHGDTMGAHKIWNKDYTMYDEIYRVPFVVRWPEVITPGTRCDSYTHHSLDLTPTFLEVSGADYRGSNGFDGTTLLPLFRGEAQERPREAFSEFHGSHMGLYTMRMLQTDRYKYIFHTNDIDELYDHRDDPHELHNLAEDPDYAAPLSELRHRMVERMRQTGDHIYNEWVVYWLTQDKQRAFKAPGRTTSRW